MSESSSNIARSNLKNKTKDIQGGEKKVMKKSLKVLASATLAFSMFASVAMAAETTTTSTDTTSTTSTTAPTAVKTSKDFKDLEGLDATVLAKIDAMLAKKYFEGTADDSFGIKENMTRAQFAKVLVLVAGVKVDDTVKTSSFADVKADDTANGWAIPFIEAAKKAGLVDGKSDTSFDPSANVTLGEFATALVKGLGIKPDTTGTPWYADAVKQAVDKKILPEGTDGSKLASRADLVVGAFQADAAIASVGKVSVTEAKAAGVYKVLVTFSKAVDTAAAKLALTKGTLAVVTSTTAPVWSEDKKSVTLTTDTRIGEGDYTVTLSGLDAANVDKTTATFKATDEQVTKIDFVNAADTVAYSASASVKVKAANQYGEAVSISTSNFTALTNGQAPTSFKKDTDGNFVITFPSNGLGISQGNGVIPVTVYYNSSNVTVSKNFKVGTVPLLSKIETGKVTYSNTTTNKLTSADDTASIPLTLLDQYGNTIVRSQFNGASPEVNASNINPVITPYEQYLVVDKAGSGLVASDLFDDNDNARLKVKLTSKVDKTAEFTVNVYGGASSATATVSVGAGNLATKVEFDTSSVSVSATDTEVFVPLIVTDANGNKLSIQDIVDNKARFNFTVSNGTAALQETGSDKGKLRLAFPSGNAVGNKVFISGQINQSQTNTFIQTSVAVGEGRYPDRIAVKTESAAKAILGAKDEVVFQLVDQYGKDLKDDIAASIPGSNGRTANYRIKAEVTRDQAGTATNIVPQNAAALAAGTTAGNVTTYIFDNTNIDEFNTGFDTLTTLGTEGKATIKVVVEKQVAGSNTWGEVSSAVSRSIQAVKANTKLTYSLNSIGSLFATKDKLSSTVGAADIVAGTSQFDKSVGVTAKDEAGNKVKLPTNFIRSLSSSDPNVILTTGSSAPDFVLGTTEKGYVLGNKAGTATVSAVVYTNTGETINLSQEVTVKADAIAVDSITAGRSSVDTSDKLNARDGFKVWQLFSKDSDNQLKVVDNYGIEYKDQAVLDYKSVLGINFTVNTTAKTGESVSINADGTVTVPVGVSEYVVTATAPNGKSVQIVVTP
ncbi:hypothetical protein GQF01_09555 [Paenibacillus sp. 5J-6]|uniref:SLH domain-containing protein n=1 Tax=Paenibacillus silvestris TaxID=2606219 RepID=A0A6L8UWV8_9BACL|nr:S-layer homology domain-containing protein [Paenibacillus silvestris]MZQ82374.1 hypothetical protein [Paenibacillus silvestris]